MTHPPQTQVTTPTGRRGTVAIPDGNPTLPLHCLVQFSDGSKQWMLAAILSPSSAIAS